MDRSSTDQTILATLLQPKHGNYMTTTCQALPWPPRPDTSSVNPHMVCLRLLSYKCLAQVQVIFTSLFLASLFHGKPQQMLRAAHQFSQRGSVYQNSQQLGHWWRYILCPLNIFSMKSGVLTSRMPEPHYNLCVQITQSPLGKFFVNFVKGQVRSWSVWFFCSAECVVWKS